MDVGEDSGPVGLKHLAFKHLRKFMDTYGQDLGFALAAVADRAGHDPAVAARHYTGRVSATDRKLSEALAALVRQTGDDQPRSFPLRHQKS